MDKNLTLKSSWWYGDFRWLVPKIGDQRLGLQITKDWGTKDWACKL